MSKPVPKWAIEVANDIKANADDWAADRIDHAEFTRRQGIAWSRVDRGEIPYVGSACQRRHFVVLRLLGFAC